MLYVLLRVSAFELTNVYLKALLEFGGIIDISDFQRHCCSMNTLTSVKQNDFRTHLSKLTVTATLIVQT